MRLFLLAAAVGSLSSSTGFSLSQEACKLPIGVFEGVGSWQDFDDGTGKYMVKTEVFENEIQNNYTLADGKEWKISLSMTKSNEGECLLSVHQEAGEPTLAGKCSELACSYVLKEDGLRLREKFMFLENKIYRTGFKIKLQDGDKGIISWEEKLSLKK